MFSFGIEWYQFLIYGTVRKIKYQFSNHHSDFLLPKKNPKKITRSLIMMLMSADSIATSRAFPAESRDVANAAYCDVQIRQYKLLSFSHHPLYILKHQLGVVILVNINGKFLKCFTMIGYRVPLYVLVSCVCRTSI